MLRATIVLNLGWLTVANWIDRIESIGRILQPILKQVFPPDGYPLMQFMSLVNVLNLENSAQHSTEFCTANLHSRILRRFSESVFLKKFWKTFKKFLPASGPNPDPSFPQQQPTADRVIRLGTTGWLRQPAQSFNRLSTAHH